MSLVDQHTKQLSHCGDLVGIKNHFDYDFGFSLEPLNDVTLRDFVIQSFFCDQLLAICCSHWGKEAAFIMEMNILKCHMRIIFCFTTPQILVFLKLLRM